jgi:branched-chain amino acid transport system ATP-binding protein
MTEVPAPDSAKPRQAMPDLLTIAGLSKSYGSLVVADAISLRVAAGEAVGIIGPNGAGKSTLFGLISGDLRPDAGRITFDGTDITLLRPHARATQGIGRSYQVPQPFEDMTTLENLLVGAYFAGRRRVRNPAAHCDAVLRRTGLAQKAAVRAGALTLLERKRLELARALAISPRLLLLDEIAGGLTDPEAEALLATIRAIHAEGVTIIWIEHVLHALLPAIGRLLVLNAGRLVADAAPQAVMADPVIRALYLGLDEAAA